ncbi:MAG: serine protease [Mesorhizobium sp.]|uniref:S1 family peptidase n=1 Tax=Mesorhizobium sp. TaxID=1871066 RepID=UPI000FE998BC|nr:serine protease [Mesorhizobium sp.]RWP10023.1 MAG: serine protease [Mesorhizobium sp.]
MAAVWVSISAAAAAPAAAVERTIVYIQCTLGAQTANGTGVIISPKGHVLTAKHVTLGPGSTCRGSIGVADPNALRMMVPRATNAPTNIDAALLQFVDPQEYASMPFCKLEDWMVRRPIFVAGFPGATETGVPSFREGVLSTVFPSSDGILETDGQTVEGMSGGPVFSHNLAGVIGIVIRADFSTLGNISYYGILPVSDHATTFGLVASQVPCYRENREVEFSGTQAQWKAGDDTVRHLGVHVDEGVCFVAGVWGLFNDAEDSVSVELQEGEYVLKGVNKSGGQHGASARCIWYQ